MYCGRQLFNSGCNNGHRSSIGSGLAYGTTTTVTVKASNSTATSEPVEYKYTKVDPSAVQKIYFDNSSYNWSDVYAYIYLGASNENAAWPGVKMTLDSATGYYVLEVPEEFAEGSVMFTESKDATTNRYPADMQPGLEIGGKNMIFKANHSWTESANYSANHTTHYRSDNSYSADNYTADYNSAFKKNSGRRY